jgi:hypothetical protein
LVYNGKRRRRKEMINKFKVYDKELSKMYEPDDIFYIRFYGNNGEPGAMVMHSDPSNIERFINYDRFVVLNFSGFKDSQGVEIYEKDLLQCDNCDEYWYEVRYSDLMGVWEVVKYDEDGEGDSMSLATLVHTIYEYPNLKIFGNDLTYKYVEEEEDGEDE